MKLRELKEKLAEGFKTNSSAAPVGAEVLALKIEPHGLIAYLLRESGKLRRQVVVYTSHNTRKLTMQDLICLDLTHLLIDHPSGVRFTRLYNLNKLDINDYYLFREQEVTYGIRKQSD